MLLNCTSVCHLFALLLSVNQNCQSNSTELKKVFVSCNCCYCFCERFRLLLHENLHCYPMPPFEWCNWTRITTWIWETETLFQIYHHRCSGLVRGGGPPRGAIRRGRQNGVIVAKVGVTAAKMEVIRGIRHLTTFGGGTISVRPERR